MALRDLLVFAIVFGAIPFILRRPWIGVLMWVWISVMNPHRLSWGLAYSFPLAQVIAAVTLIALVFSREPLRLKGGFAAVMLALFVIWMCFTTLFALAPERAGLMLERVVKIQLFTFLVLLIFYRRIHITALIWVLVLSIGYYGVKGGLFTLVTGGGLHVWGPPESFIMDNNALAVGVTITIPLWLYLFIVHRQRWLRIGIVIAVLLSAASVLGSQSRGALLALSATAFYCWLQSRTKKAAMAIVLVIAGILLVSFMPDTWTERMLTINAPTAERDASARGRLDAWAMLTNLAVDRPIVGGGFEPYTREVWDRYYSLPYDRAYSAHSIYFSVLGEHGFVGLGLFLTFWAATWLLARRLARETANRPDESWAHWLARLSQASLIAFFVGGAFLDLAYWDVPYYVFVAIAVARFIVAQERTSPSSAAERVASPSMVTVSRAPTPRQPRVQPNLRR